MKNEVASIDSRIESLLAITERQVAGIREPSSNVRGITERFDRFENSTNEKFEKIDDELKNTDVTNVQGNNIRKAVRRKIRELLGIPQNKELSMEDRIRLRKYAPIFAQRCYTEVSQSGHLAQPYRETTKANYIAAIKDIEGWTPSRGISRLIKEADDNAVARKIAEEQGYK